MWSGSGRLNGFERGHHGKNCVGNRELAVAVGID
jgi:hypothetical protein